MSKFLDVGATMAQCECLNCTSKYTKIYKSGSTPTTSEFIISMGTTGWLRYILLFSGKWYTLGLCAACRNTLKATGIGQNGSDVTVVDAAANTILYVPRSIWLGQVYKAVPSPYVAGHAIIYGGKQVESKDSGELTKLVREMMTQFHDSDKVPDTYQYQLTVEFGTLRKIAKLI